MGIIIFILFLFNYFVVISQEIYGNHGIIVNSKHIEMFLRQMTNAVSISDPSNYTIDDRMLL